MTKLNRRDLLNTSLGWAGSLLIDPWVREAWSAPNLSEPLIVIFLRGGVDGLNLVPPISGEDRAIYEAERPQIRIANSGAEGALPLNEKLGLHPSATGLHSLYQNKKLALIHACGLTANTRSHFDAQNYIELGTPDQKTTGTGWITRFLQSQRIEDPSQLQAISIGNLVPVSLLGYPEASVLNSLKSIQLGGNKKNEDAELAALEQMYRKVQSPSLSRYGEETLQAFHILKNVPQNDYTPENGASYPKEDLGNRLKLLAQLIRLKVGVNVATLDMGGWDTHKNQGTGKEGVFAKQVSQLSEAVSAFYQDLAGDFTLLILTEFGRRLKENANHGTDHGHGGVMMALGKNVKGGKVYGKWPGLKTEQLYERADLAVTTDYRSVLGELLLKRFHLKHLSAVFPRFEDKSHLGIF